LRKCWPKSLLSSGPRCLGVPSVAAEAEEEEEEDDDDDEDEPRPLPIALMASLRTCAVCLRTGRSFGMLAVS